MAVGKSGNGYGWGLPVSEMRHLPAESPNLPAAPTILFGVDPGCRGDITLVSIGIDPFDRDHTAVVSFSTPGEQSCRRGIVQRESRSVDFCRILLGTMEEVSREK